MFRSRVRLASPVEGWCASVRWWCLKWTIEITSQYQIVSIWNASQNVFQCFPPLLPSMKPIFVPIENMLVACNQVQGSGSPSQSNMYKPSTIMKLPCNVSRFGESIRNQNHDPFPPTGSFAWMQDVPVLITPLCIKGHSCFHQNRQVNVVQNQPSFNLVQSAGRDAPTVPLPNVQTPLVGVKVIAACPVLPQIVGEWSCHCWEVRLASHPLKITRTVWLPLVPGNPLMLWSPIGTFQASFLHFRSLRCCSFWPNWRAVAPLWLHAM